MTLQERMENYIANQEQYLLPRTNTFVEITIKNHDSLFFRFKKPFDLLINEIYINTIYHLSNHIDGVQFIYYYNNKIIIFIKDFTNIHQHPFLNFNKNLVLSQISSLASSFMTRFLDLHNILNSYEDKTMKIKSLDFVTYNENTPFPIVNVNIVQINDIVECENMMIYQQKLAKKEAISRIYKKHFPLKYEKSVVEKINKLKSIKVDVNAYPEWFLKGILTSKENRTFSDAYPAFDFVLSRDQLTEIIE